jgi:hypothetical protein
LQVWFQDDYDTAGKEVQVVTASNFCGIESIERGAVGNQSNESNRSQKATEVLRSTEETCKLASLMIYKLRSRVVP